MHDQIRSNKRRALVLVAGVVVVAAVLGLLVGWVSGSGFVPVAVLVVVAGSAVAASHRWSGRLVLAVSRVRAADEHEHARLHNLVDGLCLANGLPQPVVYVIDDPAPNALVVGTGPGRASIAVTTGLLATTDRVELEGLVAHLLTRVKNDDILPSTLAVGLLGWPVLLAETALRTSWWNGGREPRPGDPPSRPGFVGRLGGVLLALTSPLGRLFRMLVPADRITFADVGACSMTRYPPGLVSLLERCRQNPTVTHAATAATAHLWFGQPMSGIGDGGHLAGARRRFENHPTLDERIALVREL